MRWPSLCLLALVRQSVAVGGQSGSCLLQTHESVRRGILPLQASASGSPPPGGNATSEEHAHSIFKIKAHDLDCAAFWMIVTGMLAFTILIDRLQWLAEICSESNRCDKMFVQRVFAELMMFGVVAISLFMFSQCFKMSENVHLLLEFVDILCSFAACFLILMGIVLFFMRRHLQARLNSWSDEKEKHAIEGLRKAKSLEEIPARDLRRYRFEVMRTQFFLKHRLTLSTFSYNFFLRESLNEDICDLININWISWVITFLVSAVVLVARHDDVTRDPLSLVVGYCVVTWAVWLCCVVLLGFLWYANWGLRERLGLNRLEDIQVSFPEAVSVQEAMEGGKTPSVEVKMDDDEFGRFSRWSTWSEQSLQVLALMLCFMLGFYAMHIVYNVRHLGFAAYWHLLFLFPLATGLFVVLPVALTMNSETQAFCDPEHDVMASVMEQVAEAHEDLLAVRHQFKSAYAVAGRTGTREEVRCWAADRVLHANLRISGKTEDDGFIDREIFVGLMRELGVVLSLRRSDRLYMRVARGGRRVAQEAFLAAVFNPNDAPRAPDAKR